MLECSLWIFESGSGCLQIRKISDTIKGTSNTTAGFTSTPLLGQQPHRTLLRQEFRGMPRRRNSGKKSRGGDSSEEDDAAAPAATAAEDRGPLTFKEKQQARATARRDARRSKERCYLWCVPDHTEKATPKIQSPTPSTILIPPP